MTPYERLAMLERLLPYVPPYWARQALADPIEPLSGRQDRLQAAVLFVDISGFTPIAEALSRRGREGIEELSALLDGYLAAMSERVVALGGEVAKFAGDSLIALFGRSGEHEEHLGSALSCALRMRRAMSEISRLYTSAGTFPVRVKIGISEGSVYTTTVGDDEHGMLPVFAGRPIVRAMRAEDQADAGEIVVDATLIRRLPGHVDVGEARGTYRVIVGATGVPVLPPAQAVDLSTVDAVQVEQIVSRLVPYLAPQVIERIRQGSRGVHREVRRGTVMFVRFEGLDYDAPLAGAPSVGEALQIYTTAMRDCVLRHGGRLNEVDITVGGGVLVALFGALTAHEDDELRAAACAWEMRQALANARAAVQERDGGAHGPDVRHCVSISSGVLFVGDVGGRVRRTYAAVGDEVNLASRMSNLADWGEILVTSWIQRRTGGRFEFETRGETAIKGKVKAVPLGLLRGPRALGEENGLLARLLNRPFLAGRSAELDALRSVGRQAIAGDPQLLVLSGEAGVGKSRLIGELVHEWVEWGGAAYAAACAAGKEAERGHSSGYVDRASNVDEHERCGRWIALLRAAFGLEGLAPAAQQTRTQSVLESLRLATPRFSALVGSLLFAGEAAECQALALTGQQRVLLLQALVSLIESLAQERPFLLVLEDAHQLDAGRWALLRDLLAEAPAAPLLVCIAYRPASGPVLDDLLSPGAPFTATRLVLEPLAEVDSLSLAQHLMRDVGLQPDLAPALVRQARGNPLYLQEMVRALADAECPDNALAQEGGVPDRIASTIRSQLDPLGEDCKLTLRVAAVIGQMFNVRLLLAAHPLPISGHDLAQRLADLERMHIIQLYHLPAGGRPLDVYYCFRHALTQRVIYAGLLRADRERFHRCVGRAIEQVWGAPVSGASESGASESGASGSGDRPSALDSERSYGVLAEHFERGGVLPKAICYAVLAGQRAAEARAPREALTWWDWAQDLLSSYERSAPGGRAGRCVRGTRITILMGRGRVYCQLLKIPEAKQDYAQALNLAGDLVDLKSQADVLLFLGDIAFHQADFGRAQALIQQAIQRLVVLGDAGGLAGAQLLLSQIEAMRGGLEASAYYMALAAGDLCSAKGPARWARGAVRAYQRWLGTVYLVDEPPLDPPPAQERTDRTIACSLLDAEVAVRKGQWSAAFELVRRGMALGWASGTPLDVAYAKRVLAWLLVQVGAYGEAGDYVDEALTTFAKAEWRTGLADGYWLAGEVFLALGRHELAAERFDQAWTCGRETHAIQATVRAQIGLGKLAAARGQWRDGQRLGTEARARATQARLVSCVLSARLALARTYLGCREWRLAQRQAWRALDMARALDFAGDVLDAASVLGEALLGLEQGERARHFFREACEVAVRLADTLPPLYACTFWERASVRALRDRLIG